MLTITARKYGQIWAKIRSIQKEEVFADFSCMNVMMHINHTQNLIYIEIVYKLALSLP